MKSLNSTIPNHTVFKMDQCLSHMSIHSFLQEVEFWFLSAKVKNFGLPKIVAHNVPESNPLN